MEYSLFGYKNSDMFTLYLIPPYMVAVSFPEFLITLLICFYYSEWQIKFFRRKLVGVCIYTHTKYSRPLNNTGDRDPDPHAVKNLRITVDSPQNFSHSLVSTGDWFQDTPSQQIPTIHGCSSPLCKKKNHRIMHTVSPLHLFPTVVGKYCFPLAVG